MPRDILKKIKNLQLDLTHIYLLKKQLKNFLEEIVVSLNLLRKNLIDKIWKRNNKLSKSNFYKLPEKSAGESYKSKINKIIYNLKKRGANYHFITSSENIAWLFNIRGRDTKYTPLPHSYVLINRNEDIKFFCDLKKIPKTLKTDRKKIKFLNEKSLSENLTKINGMKFFD